MKKLFSIFCWLLICLWGALWGWQQPWAQQTVGSYSILQGVTDGNTAQFSVLADGRQSLNFFVEVEVEGHLAKSQIPADHVEKIGRPFSTFVVYQVQFKNLSQIQIQDGQLYLVIENDQGEPVDRRSFHLLNTDRRHIKVALVSCAAEPLYHSDIWQQLIQSHPDMIWFLGDNVYADWPHIIKRKPADALQFWQTYVKSRQRFDLYWSFYLFPTLATWDDHDFGMNDADRTFEFAQEGLRIFQDFYAQKSGVTPSYVQGPGVSSSFTGFGMQVIFLDDRLFRTGASEANVTATMWGEEQKKWLAERVKSQSGPLWIVNGQQFFGGYRGRLSVESDYPQDLRWLKELLMQSQRPTGLLGGDVHYSEVMKLEPELLGVPSVEITSSSMHSVSSPNRHQNYPNPRRLEGNSQHNFILLDLEIGSEHMKGVATSVNRDGSHAFEIPFVVGERF